jgi:hypothetical protein
VVLQQRPTPCLQAGVEGGVPAQADAQGLDHKGKVGQLGACGAGILWGVSDQGFAKVCGVLGLALVGWEWAFAQGP